MSHAQEIVRASLGGYTFALAHSARHTMSRSESFWLKVQDGELESIIYRPGRGQTAVQVAVQTGPGGRPGGRPGASLRTPCGAPGAARTALAPPRGVAPRPQGRPARTPAYWERPIRGRALMTLEVI